MIRTLALFLCVVPASACSNDDSTPMTADGAVADSAVADSAAPDTASASDSPPPDGPPADAATSGRLTIEANGVTGANGKIVLVFVTASGGGPILAGICEAVMADPDSVSGVASLPSMSNPCDLGAEVVLDNGGYDLQGGVYTPGMMMPDSCSNSTVTVAGDTTAIMPAFGTCP